MTKFVLLLIVEDNFSAEISQIELQLKTMMEERAPSVGALCVRALLVRLCGHKVGLAVVAKLSKALRQVHLKMIHLQLDITRCPLC